MATKPVTVGVDGSEESLQAVEWALEAWQHGSPACSGPSGVHASSAGATPGATPVTTAPASGHRRTTTM
jgi:hypothetical protein